MLVQTRHDCDGAQLRDLSVHLGTCTADDFAVGDREQAGVEMRLGAVGWQLARQQQGLDGGLIGLRRMAKGGGGVAQHDSAPFRSGAAKQQVAAVSSRRALSNSAFTSRAVIQIARWLTRLESCSAPSLRSL